MWSLTHAYAHAQNVHMAVMRCVRCMHDMIDRSDMTCVIKCDVASTYVDVVTQKGGPCKKKLLISDGSSYV